MSRAVANDRFVSVALQGAREAVSRRLALIAAREIARVQTECSPSSTATFVDGREGVSLDRVEHVVHARFSYMGRIVDAALQTLRDTSPVKSGKYQAGHQAFVDGELTTDPATIAKARRVVISDSVPYARVIEIGRGKKKPFSKQPRVPAEGPYHAAARSLQRRFGHLANIAFDWVRIDEGTVVGGSGTRSLRFPCVVIEAR